MPVFYYDHQGNLRVILGAERDRPSGSGSKKVLHGRVHQDRIVEPQKPNPNPPPDPGPREPHPQPSPDPGGSKPPKSEDDPGKIISEAAKRLLSEWLKPSKVPTSPFGIPVPSSHSGTHITAPKHIQRHPLHLPKAEYRHPTEGKIDLWHKLEQGHVLEPAETQQLFHAIDLQKYRAKTEQARQDAERNRQYVEEKLARNMVSQAQRTDNVHRLLSGVPVPAQTALTVAKANVQHFQRHDRYMSPAELAEKVQELIHESGKGYYQKSNNIPIGSNSMNWPLPLEKVGPFPSATPNILNYGYNAIVGQGQDLVVNIDRIEFSKNAEKLSSFFGRKDEFRNAYYKALKSNAPEVVSINMVEVPTENVLGSFDTVGKVKMAVHGILYKNAKGQVIFTGAVEQGSNAEVWTFPKGQDHKRDWKAEAATTVGRAIPFIQFRTIIKGQRVLTFPVIVKPQSL